MPTPTVPPPVLIDARGLKCPWPVLRAARAMRSHAAIDLLADDPVARIDIPALAQAHGWTFEIDNDRQQDRYRLRKPIPSG